ncbi:GNAT family N-acetyltransferase [Allostreptomyces psammosilenae]|uniref:GNAT superfamily N-acetyltransferase n=1 Tax=Allostreptomyces psammosilenae TaxID=1892865 RepID=A0A853A2R9_9ACTN|nr:GNAT family N-acetyltransferase [Allostreptomyces psammosilenae]NYI04758.1 GNAT superfamily N-acetyltransferase [Allostreptomyces psammosilenae]
MRIRTGGVDDVPAVLAMLDGAVAWLAARGRTGQWGSEPWSARPAAVRRVEERARGCLLRVAEIDGAPAGACFLSDTPSDYVPPADRPELFVNLLVTDRRHSGRGVGAALVRDAREEAVRRGVDLLRVDCYAGGDGRLVQHYRDLGFTPVERFTVTLPDGTDWPGQLLGMAP